VDAGGLQLGIVGDLRGDRVVEGVGEGGVEPAQLRTLRLPTGPAGLGTLALGGVGMGGNDWPVLLMPPAEKRQAMVLKSAIRNEYIRCFRLP